jgi:uncharacterized membrane protein
MNMSNKIYKMNMLSIFIAIIFVQTSIPGLGNIPIGPLSITIIPITVILSSVLLGTKFGAIIGGIWGIITFMRAFWWPTSPLAVYVFTNPFISILPRILVGLVGGLVFHNLCRINVSQRISLAIAGLLGAMVNTGLLLTLIYVFYRSHSSLLYHLSVNRLLPYLLGVASTNGLIEALLACIIVPIIGLPLLRIMNNKRDNF